MFDQRCVQYRPTMLARRLCLIGLVRFVFGRSMAHLDPYHIRPIEYMQRRVSSSSGNRGSSNRAPPRRSSASEAVFWVPVRPTRVSPPDTERGASPQSRAKEMGVGAVHVFLVVAVRRRGRRRRFSSPAARRGRWPDGAPAAAMGGGTHRRAEAAVRGRGARRGRMDQAGRRAPRSASGVGEPRDTPRHAT
jgi:hypothetical protein